MAQLMTSEAYQVHYPVWVHGIASGFEGRKVKEEDIMKTIEAGFSCPVLMIRQKIIVCLPKSQIVNAEFIVRQVKSSCEC